MRSEPIDFVQLTYNILDRDVEARLLPLARERGIAVIANRPFQGGRLFDRFAHRLLPAWAAEIDISNWAQYPLADGFLGPGWPSVRIFGVTPAPTILITFGWFLATGTRRPWVLLAIPTSASLVEAYTAFVLRIPHDATVPLAAAATFALCLRRNPTGSSCP